MNTQATTTICWMTQTPIMPTHKSGYGSAFAFANLVLVRTAPSQECF